jgi:hypothetical protein
MPAHRPPTGVITMSPFRLFGRPGHRGRPEAHPPSTPRVRRRTDPRPPTDHPTAAGRPRQAVGSPAGARAAPRKQPRRRARPRARRGQARGRGGPQARRLGAPPQPRLRRSRRQPPGAPPTTRGSTAIRGAPTPPPPHDGRHRWDAPGNAAGPPPHGGTANPWDAPDSAATDHRAAARHYPLGRTAASRPHRTRWHHAVGRARRGGHAVPSRRRPERGDTALGRHDRVRRGRGASVARRANALGRHQGIQRRRHDGNPVGRCTRRRERRMATADHAAIPWGAAGADARPVAGARAAGRATGTAQTRPPARGGAADQRRPAGER